MTETLRHKEAFELYYGQGQQRSLASVAVPCGVSEKSVATWSKAFDWQARVEQRDIENAKRLQKATDETVVAVKAKYRKVIGAVIGEFVGRLKAGAIVVDSVADLEKLIKLDLLLIGEATDSHSHTHNFEQRSGLHELSDDDLRARLEAASRGLAPGGVSESA